MAKAKTTLKRDGKKGKGEITPADGTRFTSDNQPSGEAKSLGKKKKRLLKDILELSFIGPSGGRLKKAASEYLGIPQEEITVEMMMQFRMVEKAIKDSDTPAFNAIMDRAYG